MLHGDRQVHDLERIPDNDKLLVRRFIAVAIDAGKVADPEEPVHIFERRKDIRHS